MKILCASAVVVVLLSAVDASSAVYMWVDDKGVTGFTEDPGAIPEKYRKKARIVGQEQSDDAETPAVEEVKGGKTLNEPVSEGGAVTAAPAPVPVKEQKKRYGDKDESYWLYEFAKLKADLRSYKDQLDAINARLANSGQMNRSDYKSLDLTRKLLEEQEAKARQRLEQLTREADKAGVPPDIR